MQDGRDIAEISDLPFSPSAKEEIKIGYKNTRSVLRFKIAPGNPKENLLLVLSHNLAGEIQVFKKGAKGLRIVGKTGFYVPYNQRIFPGMNVAIPLEYDPLTETEYILLRESVHRFDAKATVTTEESFLQKEANKRGAYFFYLGGFICLMLYSFFLYIATREENYLYYFLFCFFIHLDVISVIGFVDYLVKDLDMTLSQHLIRYSSLASAFAYIFGLKYTQAFQLKNPLVRFLKFLIILSFILFFISIDPWSYLFGRAYLGYLIDIIIVVGCSCIILLAIVRSFQGIIEAKFYLFSWFFMFGGVFLYMGHYFGIFSRNLLTSHGLMIGNLGEMLIVSFGLAYKINVLDKEKNEALLKAKGKRFYKRMVRALIHDLSNPLMLINHYLKIKVQEPEKFKKIELKGWEKISFGISKIEEIIEFNKRHEALINENREDMVLEKINLEHAVSEVIQMFEERYQEKGVWIHKRVDEDIFAQAERTTLIYDVFSNIFSNSLKFCDRNGNLWITSEEKVDSVVITFKDDGRGMSKEKIQEFNEEGIVQSDLGSQGEEGSGFGLYLIRSYMELYGGGISLYSGEDVGNEGLVIYLTFKKKL